MFKIILIGSKGTVAPISGCYFWEKILRIKSQVGIDIYGRRFSVQNIISHFGSQRFSINSGYRLRLKIAFLNHTQEMTKDLLTAFLYPYHPDS